MPCVDVIEKFLDLGSNCRYERLPRNETVGSDVNVDDCRLWHYNVRVVVCLSKFNNDWLLWSSYHMCREYTRLGFVTQEIHNFGYTYTFTQFGVEAKPTILIAISHRRHCRSRTLLLR